MENPEIGDEQIYPVISSIDLGRSKVAQCRVVSCSEQHETTTLLKSQLAHVERITINGQRPPLFLSKNANNLCMTPVMAEINYIITHIITQGNIMEHMF